MNITVTLNNGIKRDVDMNELLMLNYNSLLSFDQYYGALNTLRALNAAEKHGAQVHAPEICRTCKRTVITSVDPRHNLKVHSEVSAGIIAYYDKCRAEGRDSGD